MNTIDTLERLDSMTMELCENGSRIDKTLILTEYPELKEILRWIYDPMIMFHITSDNIPYSEPKVHTSQFSLISLLEALSRRQITGDDARYACSYFISEHEEYADVIRLILNKDLKCGVNVKTINEAFPGLIPTFNVPLAKEYDPNKHDIFGDTQYFLSRKLDGVRCLAFIEPGPTVRFFSRNGKEFFTLGVLAEELAKKWQGPMDVVLDGEICMVDDNGIEHFSDVISQIRRKNFEMPTPLFYVFDIYPTSEFYQGQATKIYSDYSPIAPEYMANLSRIKWLSQYEVKNREQLNNAVATIPEGWEGFILRKNGRTQFRRSDYLLKVKNFKEAEYVIVGIIEGSMLMSGVETAGVSALQILHRGFPVKVGSGLSMSQRVQWLEHPEEIIGKVATIKYFSESVDKNGDLSLRFPIFKGLREE